MLFDDSSCLHDSVLIKQCSGAMVRSSDSSSLFLNPGKTIGGMTMIFILSVLLDA